MNSQIVELVGSSGFEPPASWSRTRMTKRINSLDLGIVIETDMDMLFHGKNLRRTGSPFVMKGRNVSMHGVGIILGIVDWCGWGRDLRHASARARVERAAN